MSQYIYIKQTHTIIQGSQLISLSFLLAIAAAFLKGLLSHQVFDVGIVETMSLFKLLWISSGHCKCIGLPITLPDASFIFADLTFPSRLIISSIILPNFHNPRGISSFTITISPILPQVGDKILPHFNCVWVLSLKLMRYSCFQDFQNASNRYCPLFQILSNLEVELSTGS